CPVSATGRVPPLEVDPQLIILPGKLVNVDLRRDAFGAVHATEVEHVVVALPGRHQRTELAAATVDGEGAEVAVDTAPRAADFPHQLDHVVLADVDHVQR